MTRRQCTVFTDKPAAFRFTSHVFQPSHCPLAQAVSPVSSTPFHLSCFSSNDIALYQLKTACEIQTGQSEYHASEQMSDWLLIYPMWHSGILENVVSGYINNSNWNQVTNYNSQNTFLDVLCCRRKEELLIPILIYIARKLWHGRLSAMQRVQREISGQKLLTLSHDSHAAAALSSTWLNSQTGAAKNMRLACMRPIAHKFDMSDIDISSLHRAAVSI